MARRPGITRKKKRMAPAAGEGTLIGLRLEPALLARVDRWAASQKDGPSRMEAFRRLIELGLAVALPAGVRTARAAQAAEMASEEIDRLSPRTTFWCLVSWSAYNGRCDGRRRRSELGLRGAARAAARNVAAGAPDATLGKGAERDMSGRSRRSPNRMRTDVLPSTNCGPAQKHRAVRRYTGQDIEGLPGPRRMADSQSTSTRNRPPCFTIQRTQG